MIESNINEMFPITVSLVDEAMEDLISGKTVFYDVRYMDDSELSPAVNGVLVESTVQAGIYKTQISLPEAGNFLCYATCSGFFAGYEEIVINELSYIDAIKSNFPHNMQITDHLRTTVSSTASQLNRNVPLYKTDYITTVIKRESDYDFGNPICSGTSYAYYRSMLDELPYKMGGE